MNFDELYDKIRKGEISREEAREKISLEFIETAQKSILDINRELRTGIPEIIYGEYKSLDQTIEIVDVRVCVRPHAGDNQDVADFQVGQVQVPVDDVEGIACGARDHAKPFVRLFRGKQLVVAMVIQLT